MEKKNLVNTLDRIFLPAGFKRKGNSWVDNKGEIVKIANLQKSNFGNSFYFNYGFNLKGLPSAGTMMHIQSRVSPKESAFGKSIDQLLDLENSISDSDREELLTNVIQRDVISYFQSINTEEQIKEDLINRPNLNSVPYKVREYFNLGIS